MLRAALLLLILTTSTAHAQVRGRVVDARSGEGVVGAHIQLAGGRLERTAVTGFDGSYAFGDIPAGEYHLVIAHPGYDSAAVRVLLGLGRDVVLDVPLSLRPFPVASILVEGARGNAAGSAADAESARIDSLGLALGRRRTSLLGPQSASALADMVAADMAREPPTDPSGGRRPHVLYIWGASGERGRILLDGATLNAPLHLGALLPSIDPDLLSAAELRSGGISPRYDGGTAYIMDFASRPARSSERRAWGELDALVSRAGVAIPVAAGGIIAGARRVNDEVVDLLLGRPFGYHYADALVRADAPLGRAGAAGRLQGTVFTTREAVAIPRDLGIDEASWRNVAAALSWSDDAGHAAGRTARATFSRGVADLPLLSAPGGHVDATMDRMTLSAEQRWSRGGVGGMIGVEYEQLRFARKGRADFDPQLPEPVGPAVCTPSIPCFDTGAHALHGFAEAAWQPSRRLAASIGTRLRLDPQAGDVDVLPRLSLTSMLGGAAALTFSAGRFSQTYAALPEETEVSGQGTIAGARAAVAHANHIELNLARRAGGSAVAVSVFLRHHEATAEVAGRTTPGLDLSWAYAGEVASVSLGYSLTGRGAELAGGANTVHQLAGAGFGVRRGAMHFSASTAYGHGMPLTSIVLERPADPAERIIADSYSTGSARGGTVPARAYVRVDAALGAEWRLRWSGRELSVVPYGKIVNAFSQRDALFYYHEAGTPGEPRPLGSIPAIPVLGVRWHF
jgi:hypothetical protein